MKFVLCATALTFALVLAQGDDEKKSIAECMKDEGAAGVTNIQDAQGGKFEKIFRNKNFKCITKCMLEKKGYLEGGQLDAKKATDWFNKWSPRKVQEGDVTKCVDANNGEGDDCLKYKKITACVKKAAKGKGKGKGKK